MKTIVTQKPLENNPYAARPCPRWFRDAKVGIFVHWGPYSVPGWAVTDSGVFGWMTSELTRRGYDVDSINNAGAAFRKIFSDSMRKLRFGLLARMMAAGRQNPYAEWYWNSLRTGGATAEHHKRVWGDRSYEEFGADFNEASAEWDSSSWGELFASSGARYVITTSKHHDGFCLWPTQYPCPNVEGWYANRDLLGDLKAALQPRGIRFALYYSAGLDWTFSEKPVGKNPSDSLVNTSEGRAYFDNHLRELIDRYQPDLIWQDIGYPKESDFNALLNHYYDAVPHGVMNDRGQCRMDGNITRHFDYTTTEYFVPQTIRRTPWEICRGISGSFGYNQLDDESTTLSVEELVAMLADVVSKNGNLLLGLGPMADGTIPEIQARAAKGFGRWLQLNGEAIYGTRPHTIHRSTTDKGHEVRFTAGDDTLYAIVLGRVDGGFRIPNLTLRPNAKARLLEGQLAIPVQEGRFKVETETDTSGCCLAIDLADIV